VSSALSGLSALHHMANNFTAMCLDVNCPFMYVDLQNSLIDMHSKCGNLNFSRKIFKNMPERTVISWNAMLVGKIRCSNFSN